MSYQERVRQFPIFSETMSLILKIKTVHYGTESLSFLRTKICDFVTKKIMDSQILKYFKVGFI